MPKLVKMIKTKRYAILIQDKTLLTPKEIDDFNTLFPQRHNELVFIDALEVDGVSYFVGTNGVLIGVSTLSESDIELLLDDERNIFNKKKSVSAKRVTFPPTKNLLS